MAIPLSLRAYACQSIEITSVDTLPRNDVYSNTVTSLREVVDLVAIFLSLRAYACQSREITSVDTLPRNDM